MHNKQTHLKELVSINVSALKNSPYHPFYHSYLEFRSSVNSCVNVCMDTQTREKRSLSRGSVYNKLPDGCQFSDRECVLRETRVKVEMSVALSFHQDFGLIHLFFHPPQQETGKVGGGYVIIIITNPFYPALSPLFFVNHSSVSVSTHIYIYKQAITHTHTHRQINEPYMKSHEYEWWQKQVNCAYKLKPHYNKTCLY